MGYFFDSQGPGYQTLITVLSSRITYFFMIGLGLFLGAWFVAEDQYLRDAPTTFRKTPCVVEVATVRVLSNSRRGATSYTPAITFTYTAGGREHQATGSRLFEGGMPWHEAERVANGYRPGQETLCYYDPANPDRARFEPGRGPSLAGNGGCPFHFASGRRSRRLDFSGIRCQACHVEAAAVPSGNGKSAPDRTACFRVSSGNRPSSGFSCLIFPGMPGASPPPRQRIAGR